MCGERDFAHEISIPVNNYVEAASAGFKNAFQVLALNATNENSCAWSCGNWTFFCFLIHENGAGKIAGEKKHK